MSRDVTIKQISILSQDNVSVEEHTNMKERIQATDFLHSLNCHIVVDNMENSTSRLYGAFPARFVIIEERVITYQGGIAPFNYHLYEVQDYLRRKLVAADSNV